MKVMVPDPPAMNIVKLIEKYGHSFMDKLRLATYALLPMKQN